MIVKNNSNKKKKKKKKIIIIIIIIIIIVFILTLDYTLFPNIDLPPKLKTYMAAQLTVNAL